MKYIRHYKNLNDVSIRYNFLSENRNKAGIYMWKNIINNNTYIGSSINLSARFSKYFNPSSLSKSKMLINMAILKYKLENFYVYILEYCDEKDVINREQYYLDTYTPKYNTLKIAGSSLGYKHTEDSINKLKSRIVSEKTLSKMRNRIQSIFTRAKISKAIGIPVQVIDTHNEETLLFFSKKEASLYIGTSDSTINRYIKSGKLLFNKYLILKGHI